MAEIDLEAVIAAATAHGNRRQVVATTYLCDRGGCAAAATTRATADVARGKSIPGLSRRAAADRSSDRRPAHRRHHGAIFPGLDPRDPRPRSHFALVTPRHVAMYPTKKLTGRSLPDIARYMDNRTTPRSCMRSKRSSAGSLSTIRSPPRRSTRSPSSSAK
jgi:hypothetical protein